MRDTNPAVHRDAAQPRAGSLLVATEEVFTGILETLLRWQDLSMQRRRLLELDAYMLKDIGISRADAVREARRPFWDQPVREITGSLARPGPRNADAVTVVCCQR